MTENKIRGVFFKNREENIAYGCDGGILRKEII
jgi:hypothetical protein